MPNELKIDINGVNLSVQDSNTKGVPVIFIHPFPFNKSVWEPQYAALKKTNRVILYDVRGFGNSGLDIKKSSIALYADDLVQLMDDFKIDQAVVCGLSMGGYILLNAVERYPSRFKAIILCGTQCLNDSKEQQQARYDTIKNIEEHGLTDFAQGFIKKALSPSTLENNKDLAEKMTSILLSNSASAVTSGLSAMAQRDETCPGLKNINVPTLIVAGKNDIVIQPSQSEFLFNNIPRSKLELIEDAGHLVNSEKPEAFNKIIQWFISAL